MGLQESRRGDPAEVAASLQEHTAIRMANEPEAVYEPATRSVPDAA